MLVYLCKDLTLYIHIIAIRAVNITLEEISTVKRIHSDNKDAV